MNNNFTKDSRYLTYILRHNPKSIGLKLDREGWADINELINVTQNGSHKYTFGYLNEIVANNDKKRFALSSDGLRIRAVQGHTVKEVDIAFLPKLPPDILYHGTAQRFLENIIKEGLTPRRRHYVHLSKDIGTALAVGKRYGDPIVLQIDCFRMNIDGLIFYQADNGVWLTKFVPIEYINRYPTNATVV